VEAKQDNLGDLSWHNTSVLKQIEWRP